MAKILPEAVKNANELLRRSIVLSYNKIFDKQIDWAGDIEREIQYCLIIEYIGEHLPKT